MKQLLFSLTWIEEQNSKAVLRHDLKSRELSPEFLFHSWITCSTRSQQHQILLLVQVRGGAAGCSRQRQEVTCYLCCRGHVIMFTSPDTSSALITTNSSPLRLCLLRVCQHFFTREICFSFFMFVSCVRSSSPPHSVNQWTILSCVHTAPGFRLYTGAQEEEDKLSLTLTFVFTQNPSEKILWSEEFRSEAASVC